MATHPISKLQVRSFGPMTEVDVDLSPGLNVITGDNGTGKSQFLKLLYCAVSTVAGDSSPTKTAVATSMASKLLGVFRPDSLGRLISRAPGRSRAEAAIKFTGISSPIGFSFASNSRTEVTVASVPNRVVEDTPVFLPSRELLSLYPGLPALYDTRETEFDETWRDTALLLGRPALRGPRGKLAADVLRPLLEVIEGQVVEDHGRFYVRLPAGGSIANIEAHLVSEGFRKLAMIIRLVSSGVLLQGGYLFWDEPEANLNPRTQRAVAEAIVLLAESGTQVFVATHSVFLLRELEMLQQSRTADSGTSPRYIGLYRPEGAGGGVFAEAGNDPADLSAITALEEEARQSLRYLGVAPDES